MIKDIDINDYICYKCAMENDGKPKNEISTHHVGLCEKCKEEKDVNHVRNWVWK